MGNFKLTLGGCPPALHSVKLRLLLENRAGKGLIERIEKRNGGLVVLEFKTEYDLLAFRGANVLDIPFGNEVHHLTVLYEEKNPLPQPLEMPNWGHRFGYPGHGQFHGPQVMMGNDYPLPQTPERSNWGCRFGYPGHGQFGPQMMMGNDYTLPRTLGSSSWEGWYGNSGYGQFRPQMAAENDYLLQGQPHPVMTTPLQRSAMSRGTFMERPVLTRDQFAARDMSVGRPAMSQGGPQRTSYSSHDAGGASTTVFCTDDEPKRPLITYDLPAACDENILFFIKDNKAHLEKLENAFQDFATVQLSIENEGKARPLIKFLPRQKFAAGGQDAFNADCKKRLDGILSDYSRVSLTFDQSKLLRAQSLKLSPIVEKSYKGDETNVVVNWKKSSVDVTGPKDAVDRFVGQIKTILDFTVKKMDIDRKQFRRMRACGIVEELQQKHTTVIVECDDKTQSITLTGPADDVNNLQINALTKLNAIERKRLTGVDQCLHDYLVEMMKESTDVKIQIQDKFVNDGVKADLYTDTEDVYIAASCTEDCQKARVSLEQLIGLEAFPIDEKSSVVISSPQWEKFNQSLKTTGRFRVFVKPRQEIIAVGIRSELKELSEKIKVFFDENITKRRILKMPYGKARFILEKSHKFSGSCRKKGIKCGLTSDGGGGVYLEGRKAPLSRAYEEMSNLEQMVEERQRTLDEAGIKQYFQEEEGKEFLKVMERANYCIILTTKTCPEWAEAAAASPSSQNPREQLYISAKLPNSHVSLQVWKANITEHSCDVIINASNEQLQLLSAGISGAIRKIDTRNKNVIQQAMSKLVDENYGINFLPGDALITAAGNMRNCKRIVHAIGPRWSLFGRDPRSALKSCIRKSLEETSRARMTSIAIPAVSCGEFGGRARICIPLILEAVVEYFEEETATTIRRVDFIEDQNEDILNEFKRSVQQNGDPNSASGNHQEQPPPTPTPGSSSVQIKIASSSNDVELLVDDITNVKTDRLIMVEG